MWLGMHNKASIWLCSCAQSTTLPGEEPPVTTKALSTEKSCLAAGRARSHLWWGGLLDLHGHGVEVSWVVLGSLPPRKYTQWHINSIIAIKSHCWPHIEWEQGLRGLWGVTLHQGSARTLHKDAGDELEMPARLSSMGAT